MMGKGADVFELQYMRKIRFLLNGIGLWPNKEFGDDGRKSKTLRWFHRALLVFGVVAISSQLTYLKKHLRIMALMDLGHMYLSLVFSFGFAQRLSMGLDHKFREICEEFANTFNLIHHRNKSVFALKINKRVQKICDIATKIADFMLYLVPIAYNVFPLYNNYKKGMFSDNRPVNATFEHATYYALPFDPYTNPRQYSVMVVFNVWVVVSVSISFCGLDLLICLMVFHIWGHLSILKQHLDAFLRPTVDVSDGSSVMFTDEENQYIFQQLTDLMKYHLMIKEFMNKTSAAFSIFLAAYFTLFQLNGCVLLLECSAMRPETLGKFGPLTIFIYGQLIQLSVVFELIGSKGDTLIDAVYCLPWESMNASNKRMVLLFLQNVQTPLSVKAGEMVPVGVQTMQAIMKTSISYFVMLKTFS